MVRHVVGLRCVIVVSGLPPMRRFPKVVAVGVPLPILPCFLGAYVDALSNTAQRVCALAEFPGVHFLCIDFLNAMRVDGGAAEVAKFFASDGFHPAVYAMDRHWSPLIAQIVVKQLALL